MITSPHNPKVKLARALHRRRVRYAEQRFLVEGIRLLEELQRAGITPVFVLYSERVTNTPRGRALLDQLRRQTDAIYQVPDTILAGISDTVTPQGIVAVVPMTQKAPPEEGTLLLIVDRLKDPGNLGTLLRSAEAAGADHVILAPGCVDPYNPKVVRAGMGVHFRLPLTIAPRWAEITQWLGKRPAWLADVAGEQTYFDIDWRPPSALIIGSEAHGASPQAQQLATGTIRIPMTGAVESLNAAIAGSVILFEAQRQRLQDARTRDRPTMPPLWYNFVRPLCSQSGSYTAVRPGFGNPGRTAEL